MEIGHSAAVQMDDDEGGGSESTRPIRTPIFSPAGVLADNRNPWQGSPGGRVCLCVVRVCAFKKRERETPQRQERDKRCIKDEQTDRQSGGGGGKRDRRPSQDMKPSSRQPRLNGVCGSECRSFQ